MSYEKSGACNYFCIITAFFDNNSTYKCGKNANPQMCYCDFVIIIWFLLCDNRVCVFGALTSVDALFVFWGENMTSVEEKVLNIDGLKRFLLEEYNLNENVKLNKLLHEVRSITSYGDAELIEKLIEEIKSFYAKQVLKVYECGLTDGVKLCYEIREKN